MWKEATKYLVVLFIISMISACVTQPHKPSPEIQSLINLAKSGDTEAQFKLGSAYDSGHGVGRNGKEALKWYTKAAEAGHAEAQNSLGSIYQAEKQFKLAYEWYKKAEKQNHSLAINNLGYLHDLGLGVPQDRQKAYELYQRSANLGWGEAMFNIGQMLGSGQLGEVDLMNGCVWTIRALKYSSNGRAKEQAKGTVNFCKQKLTKEEYNKAENIANKWSPK